MKKCTWCAEDIQGAALVCKHCGRPQPSAGPVRVTALGYLIPLLALVLLIGAGTTWWLVRDSMQKAQEAETFGKPLPTTAERDRILKQQIYNAVFLSNNDRAAVAKRYNRTLAEVDAIVDEGTRLRWPKP